MTIDEKTFRQLYENYFEIICLFLNRYTHEYHIIEEVVQDIFSHLWEERNTLDIRFIKTYLYNSARNRMLNYLRDKENRVVLLERWARQENEYRQGKDCVDSNEFFYYVQLAVQNLPPACRDIYTMSREEKLSYKEIAEKKNISVKTVETQMGIALKRIREELNFYYERKKK